MAEEIPISRLHNQEVNFYYNNNAFVLHLFSFNGYTFLDLKMNGEWVLYAARCVANQYILWNAYLTSKVGGNFRFKCVDDSYPYFPNFGLSQTLEFVPLEEIE